MNQLFEIIYEDQCLLLINKPPGLVCHPTKGDAYSSLISRVRLYLGGFGSIHLVNRLDRETSGLVMVAKDDETAAAMRRRWESGKVRKGYLAVVEGHVPDSDGLIDAPIGPDPLSVVAIKGCVRPDGAQSQTWFHRLHHFKSQGLACSLLRVEPRTGRKHQIRIHLAHFGYPIVGDKLYGWDENCYLAFVAGRLEARQWARLRLQNHALHGESLEWEDAEGIRAYVAPMAAELGQFISGGEPAFVGDLGGVTRLDAGRSVPQIPIGEICSKDSKKKLTLPGCFGIFAPHTEPNTRHTMRTKTLLITAALSLAGVATSMAQVYSVNAVGYINLTLRPGFNLVANQLNKTPSNGINNVITGGLEADSQVLKYINNPPGYDIEFHNGTILTEVDFVTPGNMVLNPGEGFFIFNSASANTTVTLVGEVPQGQTSVPIPANFSLISSVVPQALPLTAANGFPQESDAQYVSFNPVTQNYDDIKFNNGGQWVAVDFVTVVPTPTPAVGQGFFYYNPGNPTTWVRSFSVN